MMLIKRAFQRQWLRRLPEFCAILVVWFVVGLAMALAMKDQVTQDVPGIVSRMGLFFGLLLCLGILTMPSCAEFAFAKRNALHELSSCVCSAPVYLLCITVESFLERLLVSLPTGLILIAVLPLRGVALFVFLIYLTATSFKFCAQAFASNFGQALALNAYNGLLVYVMIFGVTLFAIDPSTDAEFSSNEIASFISKFSFASYLLTAFTENEIGGGQSYDVKIKGVTVSFVSGDTYLESLGMKGTLSFNILVAMLWILFFWALALLGLYRSLRPRTRAAVAWGLAS